MEAAGLDGRPLAEVQVKSESDVDGGDGREERETQARHADSTWKLPSLGGRAPGGH